MFKRRPLNKNSNGSGQGQSINTQNQGQQQQQPRHRHHKKNKGHHHHQRRHNHRPQQPAAYMQRDLLLMANKETAKSIEEVRLRFDPLSKKLSAHVTLLLPEPAAKLASDIIKKSDLKELPSLQSLTFNSIQVVDDMYLWLIPDDESTSKLKQWHGVLIQHLNEHTQGEKFEPHLTLGYIPRKVPEEDALAFAQNLITTPITIKFDSLLLEEFSEDQNSRSLDRFQILR